MQNARIPLVFAICLLTVAGCGSQAPVIDGRTAVKGTVMLDGQPLAGGGTVKFESVENKRIRVSVSLDSQGQFLVGDAPSGRVKMSVITTPEIYPEMTPIPKRYSKVETSGLEMIVVPNGESFEIELTSKKTK